MKVFQINGGSTGSTGKIMFGIRSLAEQQGICVYCASPITQTNRSSEDKPFIPIGSYYGRLFSELLARFTGLSGCFSVVATHRLLRRIDRVNPDIMHLHTLHSSYINLPMLFRYIRRKAIPVVWTLHDCWTFTGHCPHFVSAKCEKWKHECGQCPLYRQYPVSYFDNSRRMFRLKKKWFTTLPSVTLVAPSQWLADIAAQSFLGAYPIAVMNNGIDLDVFRPTDGDIRHRYQTGQRKIILGVSYGWNQKKGLDVFLELACRLPTEAYQIILVGTDGNVEKELPPQIIAIRRTQNQQELAALYTAADVFVNPTREDTFPTVNMEALACGTPVLTFRTGGSPEMLDDTCGAVVEQDDFDALETQIHRICQQTPYSSEDCRKYALRYNQDEKFQEYIDLYRRTE